MYLHVWYDYQDKQRLFEISWDSYTWGVKLTTRLHLVPRLRIHGAVPLLHHTFSWHGTYLSTGITLHLLLTFVMDTQRVCYKVGAEFFILYKGIFRLQRVN
jgi:hypothetical protein